MGLDEKDSKPAEEVLAALPNGRPVSVHSEPENPSPPSIISLISKDTPNIDETIG